MHGRVLILEGIEKAERNVLPVLNNLLENREMQLDDGRFLMSASRYDKLLMVNTLIYLMLKVLDYRKRLITHMQCSPRLPASDTLFTAFRMDFEQWQQWLSCNGDELDSHSENLFLVSHENCVHHW